MARSYKIKTIVAAFGNGDIRAKLLPDEDKISIMEYMLQCTETEIKELSKENKPCFVSACAKLLIDGDLEKYLEILNKIKHEKGI